MIYQYRCDTCGVDVDKDLNPNKDNLSAPRRCTVCNAYTLRRVFTDALIIPFQWTQDSYRFDKRPRERRKYK